MQRPRVNSKVPLKIFEPLASSYWPPPRSSPQTHRVEPLPNLPSSFLTVVLVSMLWCSLLLTKAVELTSQMIAATNPCLTKKKMMMRMTSTASPASTCRGGKLLVVILLCTHRERSDSKRELMPISLIL